MHNSEFLVFLILVLLVGIAGLLFRQRKDKKLREELFKENAKLIADNALLEADHLKFQLQPHTLRNMIASLHVASKNLYRGTEALANTLDYVIYSGNQKQLVSIKDEVIFLENYKELQGNFVNQIDNIKINTLGLSKVSQYYQTECLPHLTMAYFVENAFKHGDIYHPEFLNVRIVLTDSTFELHVTNKSKPKLKSNTGGLGLVNMQKRLDLLLPGKFEIKTHPTEKEFNASLTITF